MTAKVPELTSWMKALRVLSLTIAIVLPFLLQKAHLDVTRGDWRPDLATFASHLIVPSLLLPGVAVFFWPVKWQVRLAIAIALTPILIFAFGYFTVDYACNNYNGHCF